MPYEGERVSVVVPRNSPLISVRLQRVRVLYSSRNRGVLRTLSCGRADTWGVPSGAAIIALAV